MLEPLQYHPPNDPVDVVHLDAQVLLVNKPSGLLSVPGKAVEHRDCLETRIKAQFPAALLVHRLDMDTSGLMVFAMSQAAQRHLGLQFERRHMEKTYIAEVFGSVTGQTGQIDLPLIVDWPRRPLQKVCFETGKAASTGWQVIGRSDGRTRLRLFPRTGRSHQLRVHLKEIGHPILGDRLYAQGAALAAADRLLLHSESLSFYHPEGGARVRFDAPCPF